MELIGAIGALLLLFHGLKFMAHLLQSEDRRQAGGYRSRGCVPP